MLNMFYQRMCWRTNIQEEIVGILLMGIALPHVVSVQARKIDFQHYTCNVVSFSCSISWGQRWLFALLILMELCTITVKTFFSKHIQFVYTNTIISLKMRTLFDGFLHKISPFKKNNTLNWKLVVGLCKNSLTQNSVCYESDKKNPSGGKEFEMKITKLYLKINNVIYSA